MEHGVGGESTLHPVLKVRLSRQLVHIIYARVAAHGGHAHIARRHIYTPRVTLYTRTCEKSGVCHYSVHAVLCSWHTQQQRLENFKRPTPRRPR
jgi:hypothetical protein